MHRATEGRRRVRSCRGFRPVALSGVAALLLGLPACGGEAEEEGKGLDIAEIQGAFESGDAGSVTGEKTTLTAEVGELISPSAFVIADEAEPLLVVAKDMRIPDEGDQVRLSGTVHEFDFSKVHERLGVDMAKPLFDEYQGEPYLWAERIKADADL